MRDLVLPEPERTRNILSAIINFIKFAEERGSFLKKLRDQSISGFEEKERMTHMVAELRQKIAEIQYVAKYVINVMIAYTSYHQEAASS